MSNKWVECISRALLPCFVFFVFSFSFVPKAYAAESNLAIAYGVFAQTQYTTGQVVGTANYVTTETTPIVDGLYQIKIGSGRGIVDAQIYTDTDTLFYDNVKIYAAYYYYGSGLSVVGDPLTETWDLTYVNDYGEMGSAGGLDVFKTVNNSRAFNGLTYVMEASFVGTEVHPIKSLSVKNSDFTNGFLVTNTSLQSGPYIAFPSIRVITTAYSAEMEALDKVADEIAAQSDILLAMKGDIVAILQDIYTMTGDMYVAQNLLNSYVAQLLPLIQNIDQTTTNIYSLLSTQLRLLETAIENAADSIEAAIAAQTAAMIAYLEQYFNTGNEVPDDTYQQQQDAENILDQMGSLEKPDVNTVVPEIGDYTDGGVSGVLGAIFSSNLIVTMMTLSASFAFGAYVLFGKRD